MALSRPEGPPAGHLRVHENAKIVKYVDDYRAFKPFVIDLGGAVSERSDGALKSIAKEASNAATPRLHWACFDWAARMQRASLSPWCGQPRG